MKISEKSREIIKNFYKFQETNEERWIISYTLEEVKVARIEFQKEKWKNNREGFEVIDELMKERTRKFEKFKDEKKKRQEKWQDWAVGFIGHLVKSVLLEHFAFFAIAGGGIISISLILAAPDMIEKKFYPHKYWSNIVKSTEREIERLEFEIDNVQIDLQETRITAPLEVSRSQDEKIRELTAEFQKASIKIDQRRLDLLEESLSKKRKTLEKAKFELFKETQAPQKVPGI